jgi:hypothetical protein
VFYAEEDNMIRQRHPRRIPRGERRWFDVIVTHRNWTRTDTNGCGLGPTADVERTIDRLMMAWYLVCDMDQVIIQDRATGEVVATLLRTPDPRYARIVRPGRPDEVRRATRGC